MNDRELRWLRKVRDFSHALAAERDPESLPPLILDASIELTGAERGFLVRAEPKAKGEWRLRVSVARGFDLDALRADPVSQTVVQRVIERGEGVVTTSEGDADLLNVTSVQHRGVVSILSCPMRLRGEILGVLYLDHRVEESAFDASDLSILATFADQAALALETAQRYERQRGTPQVASYGRLIGASAPMRALYEEIERASRTWEPVLIQGETGAGKATVARELHERGSFPDSPFLEVSLTGVDEASLARELFGHVRGRSPAREGVFARAGRGTVVLAGVADVGPEMQARLLRLLGEGVVQPVGSTATRCARARLVFTGSDDLLAQVEAGRLSEDLYYRLDVLRIQVPALRTRFEDLPALLQGLARRAADRDLVASPEALEVLGRHAWPGNVRELENEVRRLVHAGVTTIEPGSLSIQPASPGPLSYDGRTLGEIERDVVLEALRRHENNRSRAARALGIPRTTLYRLLERYDLS